MSKLLLDERPLLVLPALAQEIGLNEAITLQQLHWMLQRESVLQDDGRDWLKMDLAHWRETFPFWAEATIRRNFHSLREAGLVETKRGRESNVYAVNYDALEALAPAEAPAVAPPAPGEPQALPGMEQTALTEAVKPLEDDVRVVAAWTHYLEVFGDRLRVRELTPPRRRTLSKALKAADGDADLCKRAIDGLKSYRDKHSAGSQDVSLDVIFSTGPNDRSNLTDKIEWWASQAQSEGTGLSGVPSVHRDRIMRRRVQVVEMYAQPDNVMARERGEEALEWLKKHAHEEPTLDGNRVTGWTAVEA